MGGSRSDGTGVRPWASGLGREQRPQALKLILGYRPFGTTEVVPFPKITSGLP